MAMLRLKGSILNEPEFWLALLRIPPQALGRLTREPSDACGRRRIDPPRADEHSDDPQVGGLARDSGLKCKV
jgi:hypothetical protein